MRAIDSTVAMKRDRGATMKTPPGPTISKTAKRALEELGHELAQAPTEATTVKLNVKLSVKPSPSGGPARKDVLVVVIDETGATVQRLERRTEPGRGSEPAPDDVRLFFQTMEVMRAQKPAPELPEREAALLDAAGFTDDPLTATLVMEQSRREFEALLALEKNGRNGARGGSISLEHASKALGVTPSRLRQRLGAERTLYGVKQGREWRIPLFQFEPRRNAQKGTLKLVRNIDKVLAALSPDVHPLAVRSFFLLENSDLVVASKKHGDPASEQDEQDEEPVSPIAWLSAGNPPDEVIALAQEL